MIWSLIQQVGGQMTTMVVFLVLAAMLPPSDFGIVGMAGAWLAVLSAFGEAGFGAALIQREELREDHLRATFGINVMVGALLTAVGVALSWPAAVYFKTPQLQPVMALLSLGFLVRAFGLTQSALAQRELRFRALALRDLTAAMLGGFVGMALALSGYGVWSLVTMTLVTALLQTLLLWRLSHWRPRAVAISRQATAELWPYSSRMLGFNLFKAVAQNTDRLIIGPTLGAPALGLYSLGFRAVIYPVTTFVGALGAYLFPKVSRLQSDRDAVAAMYRNVLVGILYLVLPGLLAVALLAPVIVPILGPRWHDAVPVIQILTIVGLTQALMAPVGQIMKGLGRPGWLIAWSVGLTVVTSITLWLGTRWGLTGATLGFALAHGITLPVIFLIGRHLTGLGTADVLRLAWRPVGTAACLGAVLVLFSRLAAGWPAWTAVLGSLLIGSVYFVLIVRGNPELKAMIMREYRKIRVSGDTAPSVPRPVS